MHVYDYADCWTVNNAIISSLTPGDSRDRSDTRDSRDTSDTRDSRATSDTRLELELRCVQRPLLGSGSEPT